MIPATISKKIFVKPKELFSIFNPILLYKKIQLLNLPILQLVLQFYL